MRLARIRPLALCGSLACLLALAACQAGETTEDGGGGQGGGGFEDGDSDGDTILDSEEGRAAGTDTDLDTIPDYLDTDSDNDGILDAKEAGDADLTTAPRNNDADATPDFQDLDSDDNAVPDELEGVNDPDGDGLYDAADPDNDGDGATDADEIAGAGADCDGDASADAQGNSIAPQDCDSDGTANWFDLDSDGDGISDGAESAIKDTDADGFLDRYDLDSDNDQIPDSVEAGDTDVGTAPLDTDSDGTPDFTDPDSDSDGVSDLDEHQLGTDPTDQDSDDDGADDLIETAAGTDPLDSADNPQANGDFVFVVPYEEPTTPPDDTLEFRTNIQYADLYFSIDTTGSMIEEFDTLQSTLVSIINTLQCAATGNPCTLDQDCGAGEVCFDDQCIEDPNLGQGCVPNMWTGVGHWNDINTFHNVLSLQPDPPITAAVIDPGTYPGGSEAIYQPPTCVANPMLCQSISAATLNCAPSGIGCPGYRSDAIRLYIHVSDANDQCSGGGCASYNATIAGNALVQAGIKFVALYGTDDGSGQLAAYNALATAAQSLDGMGNPLVYAAADAAVQSKTVQAVLDIVKGKPLDVTIAAEDQPNDAGDALQFIDYFETNTSGVGACTSGLTTEDTDADTYDDAFPDLLPGTRVCWDVHPVPVNNTAPPTEQPQLFIAKAKVLGDGSLVDDRKIFFLVPPKPAEIPQ